MKKVIMPFFLVTNDMIFLKLMVEMFTKFSLYRPL